MKFPITAEDFKNEFLKSVDMIDKVGDLRIRQFIQILPKINDPIIIEGVILIFENEERADSVYTDQKYAGLILQKMNPKTEQSADLILGRTLKNWNKSVYELLFWLKENYGIENLKNVFNKLEKRNLSDLEFDKLNTMKWMLQMISKS